MKPRKDADARPRRRPCAEAQPTLRMRMRSRREAIAPAVERILAFTEPAGFSLEQRENLAVALAEALSNAAVHGNRLAPKTRVCIDVEVEPALGAVIEIRDAGSGFHLDSLPDPSAPDRLLETHGRGVFLMRRLLDAVEYNDVGNSVRLTLLSRNGAGPD